MGLKFPSRKWRQEKEGFNTSETSNRSCCPYSEHVLFVSLKVRKEVVLSVPIGRSLMYVYYIDISRRREIDIEIVVFSLYIPMDERRGTSLLSTFK